MRYELVKNCIVLAVAIALTLTSASMTILGYTSLYAENIAILATLFVVLESTKAVIFGIIFVSAKAIHKIPLLILAIALIVLSFIGHLSYLSKSYNVNKVAIQGNLDISNTIKQSVDSQIKGIEIQIDLLQNEIKVGNDEIVAMRNVVNDLTKPNARQWAQGVNKKRVVEITQRNNDLTNQIQELYKQRESIQKQFINDMQSLNSKSNDIANRSVFTYTAEIFNISQDKLANIINIILSLVIDSLALILLWVAGDMWREYRDIQSNKEIENVNPQNNQNNALNNQTQTSTTIDTTKDNKTDLNTNQSTNEVNNTPAQNNTNQSIVKVKDNVSIPIKDFINKSRVKNPQSLNQTPNPPPLFQQTQNTNVFGIDKEIKAPKENITHKNIHKFFFEGNSVQDAINMQQSEFDKLKDKITTADQLEWMRIVDSMRE